MGDFCEFSTLYFVAKLTEITTPSYKIMIALIKKMKF